MEANTSTNDVSIVGNVLNNINQDRLRKRRFCDSILKSNDGCSFSVHRIILSSASKVFECLFNYSELEGNENGIVLKNISRNNLEFILNYIYTGNADFDSVVNYDNNSDDDYLFNFIASIMKDANYLDLKELVKICGFHLSCCINFDNFLELMRYSDKVNSIYLKESCIKYIFNRHHQISMNKNIMMDLKYKEIKMLAHHDKYGYLNRKIYCFLAKWIIADTDLPDRLAYGSEFFDKLKICKLAPEFYGSEYLKTFIEKSGQRSILCVLIEHSKNYFRNLSNGLNVEDELKGNDEDDERQHLDHANDQESNEDKKSTDDDIGKNDLEGNYIGVCKCDTRLCDDSIIHYRSVNNKNEIDLERGLILKDIDIFYAGTKLVENEIFVCGGLKSDRHPTAECMIYNSIINEWRDLPSMSHRRSRHSAINLRKYNQIFVFGGQAAKIMEVYDVGSNRWLEYRHSLDFKANFRHICTLQHENVMYMVTNNGYVCQYDPRIGVWDVLSHLPPGETPRELQLSAPAMLYDDNIYFMKDKICRYDIKMDEWSGTNLHYKRNDGAMTTQIPYKIATINDKLCLIENSIDFDTFVIDIDMMESFSLSSLITLSKNSRSYGLFSF